MKQACVLCERTAPAGRLFCHLVECPAETSPSVLEVGDRVSDIEVVRRIASVRSATLYDAVHQGRRVFMKIAHPGHEHARRLKREASALRALQADKVVCPTLPRLRAPYPTTTLEHDAYGKVMLGDELMHFSLCEPFDGEPLSDLLLKQAQWCIQHVGWLAIQLASTLNALHLRGLYHLGLSPACVLVGFDRGSTVPRAMVWDLGIASDAAGLATDWYPRFAPPAYLAPELQGTGRAPLVAGVGSDVYGVGLVLYEMLVGQPAFPSRLAREAEVRSAVQRNARVRMNRLEDVAAVAQVAMRATAADSAARQPSAADLAEELTGLCGSVPPRQSGAWPALGVTFSILSAILTIAFLISLAVALTAQ
jgi:serine/threonine protein kinase